jgi:hypothetical protein
MEIKPIEDINNCIGDNNIFGCLKISNKPGVGLSLLVNYISKIQNNKKV